MYIILPFLREICYIAAMPSILGLALISALMLQSYIVKLKWATKCRYERVYHFVVRLKRKEIFLRI